MPDSTFARLREFRLSRNFTLQHLADLLGVKLNTLARWERGELAANTKLLALALDTLEIRYQKPENISKKD